MDKLPDELIENGIYYTLHGDYNFPDIIFPKADARPTGKWGWMHKRHLQEYRPILYNQFVLQGKLSTYLVEINVQAQQRLEMIIQQTVRTEDVDERLKAQDQQEWIRRMNNIRQRAEESIMAELISSLFAPSVPDFVSVLSSFVKPFFTGSAAGWK